MWITRWPYCIYHLALQKNFKDITYYIISWNACKLYDSLIVFPCTIIVFCRGITESLSEIYPVFHTEKTSRYYRMTYCDCMSPCIFHELQYYLLCISYVIHLNLHMNYRNGYWIFFCVFPIEMQRHYRQNYYDYLSHCNVPCISSWFTEVIQDVKTKVGVLYFFL